MEKVSTSGYWDVEDFGWFASFPFSSHRGWLTSLSDTRDLSLQVWSLTLPPATPCVAFELVARRNAPGQTRRLLNHLNHVHHHSHNHNRKNHNNQKLHHKHHKHQVDTAVVGPVSLVSSGWPVAERDSGAARRRRERQLHSFVKDERMRGSSGVGPGGTHNAHGDRRPPVRVESGWVS